MIYELPDRQFLWRFNFFIKGINIMKKLVLLTSLLALCACGGGSGGGSGAPLPPSSDVVGPSDTPDSGGGNTGDENIGGGENTGGGKNTGGGNAGDENIGGGDNNTGDNTGDDNTGGGNTGGDNTGDDEPDLPVIIAPELFSGNLHMMPKVTDGGEGPTETYYLIADANTGDVVMRTYITECPSDQTCESDSRGFIKNSTSTTGKE